MKRIFTVVLIAALLSLCLGAAALADETEEAALTPVGAEEAPVEEAPVEEVPVEEEPVEEPAAEEPEQAPAEEAPVEEVPAEEVPAEDAEPAPEADGTQITAGTCGEKAAWSYDPDTKTLTVTGEGTIDAITKENAEAWADAAALVIEDGITEIGRDAFSGLENLEKVTLPDSVEKLGAGSFLDCPELAEMTVPNKDCEFETYAADENGDEIKDTTAKDAPAVCATVTPFDSVYSGDENDTDAKDAWEKDHPLNEDLVITAPQDSTAETFCDTYPQTFKEIPEENTDDKKDEDNKKDTGNKDTGNNTNTNNTNTNNNTTNNTTGSNSQTTSNSPSINLGSVTPTPSPTPLGANASASPAASGSSSPRTGDDTPIALYIVLVSLLTAAAGCTGVILVRKSRG